jgi:hypothetical protein
MKMLNASEVAELLAIAAGNVSYVSDVNSFGVKGTAIVADGRWISKRFASDVLAEVRKAEFDALYPPKPRLTVKPGKRTAPYAGSFPRGKHSHRCINCDDSRGVACYKSHCTRPQVVDTCPWCASKR